MPEEKRYDWLWPVKDEDGRPDISRGFNDKPSGTKSKPHGALDITGGSEIRATKAGTVVQVFEGCNTRNGGSEGAKNCTNKKVCSPIIYRYKLDENYNYVKDKNGNYIPEEVKNKYSNGFCNFGVGRGLIIDHGNGIFSYYAHMKTVAVKLGDQVYQGQILGEKGATGCAAGAHLHFGILYKNGLFGTVVNAYNCNPANSDINLKIAGGTTGNYRWRDDDKGRHYDPVGIGYIMNIGDPCNINNAKVLSSTAEQVTQYSVKVTCRVNTTKKQPSTVSLYYGKSKNSMKLYKHFTTFTNGETLSANLLFLSMGTTYYYEWRAEIPNSGRETAEGQFTTQESAGNIKNKVQQFLTGEMGLNRAAAEGIIAYINSKSGFVPDTVYGKSGGGLCRWTGDRLNKLKKWCKNNNQSAASLEGQLGFLKSELTGSFNNDNAHKLYTKLRSVPNTKQGAYDAGFYMSFYYGDKQSKPARDTGNTAAAAFGNGSYRQDDNFGQFEIYNPQSASAAQLCAYIADPGAASVSVQFGTSPLGLKTLKTESF